MKRARVQKGSLVLNRKYGTWNFLWFENGRRRSQLVGSIEEYPTRESARKLTEPLKRKYAMPNVNVPNVRTLVQQYQEDRMPNRHTTRRGYEGWLKNHILPTWGDSFITDLRPRPVELWLRSLPLAAKSKVHIRGLLRILWDYAMWSEIVAMQENPIRLVAIKGATTRRVRKPCSLTDEQFHGLLQVIGNDPCWRTMLLLAVSFGLRISELLGLKWKDIDWLGKTIRIERGVVKQIVDDVKSSYSARAMVIADDLLDVLKQWKQTTEFSASEDWIFASPVKLGRQPLSYTHVWRTLSDAATRAGMGHISSHSFRHTYRTWLDSVGTPVGVQQKLMRHADIRTTMNVYGDAPTKDMRNAHEKVVRIALPKAI
jgi:integrase